MHKCKQCEWEFPDDIHICPYCRHPVEPDDKKQKRRFNLRWRPNLPGGVKQSLPGLRPSQSPTITPSKKHFQQAILVSTIIVALVLTGVLLARANLADQSFTVSSSLLDFGPVRVGSKSVLSVVIMKSSEFRLHWQIDPANVQWLQVALRPKADQSSNLREDIYDVIANTDKLKVRNYSARLIFSSERGNTQLVNVKLQVIANRTPPANLNVSPLTLDFGSLKGGDQKILLLTVSNSGGQELRWTADKGRTLWLTLDHYSGKIAAGAIPQSIKVMVDTTTLTADQYSTTINFRSNDGNASVVVRLIVIPTSTPTPTPPIQRPISSTQTQSQTVQATGTVQVPATQATGTLTFYNLRTDYSLIVPAGQTWTGTDGIQVVNDAPVCLDPLPVGGYTVGYSVPAHTLQTGTAANIAVNDVNMIWGISPFASTSSCTSPSTAYSSAIYASIVPFSGTQEVRNNKAFTGGKDPYTYTEVKQSDIDGIANSLKKATQQSAIDDIHQQLQPNEHLVGAPHCASNVFSDHNAGDRATQVTVIVTTTCKATAST
jgi:hypothetical protein